MDRNGKYLSKHEKYKDKQLFTYPERIATTKNGNFLVLDGRPSHKTSGVIVIKPGSDKVGYYSGHSDITTDDKPFKPRSVLTPKDNILLINLNTTYPYILNNNGDFITFYNLADNGLNRPYSLGLSPSGTPYIGRANAIDAPKD